ncbi:MAG: hypothetical protein LH609_03790, partial [Rudanella sp.]|nr:hypothetical protein [Rudanella sp.]
MNDFLICVTCGTQIPTPVANSIGCPICNDDRQYVPEGGQQWTTHDELLHTSSVRVLQLHERVYEFV